MASFTSSISLYRNFFCKRIKSNIVLDGFSSINYAIPHANSCRYHKIQKYQEPTSFARSNSVEFSRDHNLHVVNSDHSSGFWPPENKTDDTSLNNPLLRQDRLGCNWLAVIMEWEGVIVESKPAFENKSWITLSQEQGLDSPPIFLLNRIQGMKSEQAISEVLCWSRDPFKSKKLAERKEEIYQSFLGGAIGCLKEGSQEFLENLVKYKIPIAVISTRPKKHLLEAIEVVKLEGFFKLSVGGDDVYRGKPDPEMLLYAALRLGVLPERCVVFGSSNSSVEAAHEVRMKCVGVAGKDVPLYLLGAAELVVRRLDEISLIDVKKLAEIELQEFGMAEPETQVEDN